MAHQLDRIEAMLQMLTDKTLPNDTVHRGEMQKHVLDLFKYIWDRKLIEAIKEYRFLTGYGLKESKDEIMKIDAALQREAA